jgi:outer membrane protein insertion porin family
MTQVWRACLAAFAAIFLFADPSLNAQTQPAPTPAAGTETLREIRADGVKSLTAAQVASLSGLQTGMLAGRDDLQTAADKLVATGLFANVKYNFQTRVDGLVVTFHVEEVKRIPAYFDNIPWFTDGELNDAIRAKVPLFDGTLPSQGSIVDQAADAISAFLAQHGLQAAVEHQAMANPSVEGNIQEFHIEGGSLRISSLTFGDDALNKSPAIQQSLSELKGKPYSRMAIDLFLTEQVRPVYLKQGYLLAKLGPPEIRLTGNPNQKLPEQIPVFVPIAPGDIYRWKGAQWTGNSVLSTETLNSDLGLKVGEIADGTALQAGVERAQEEYGHIGYLDAQVEPQPQYDRAGKTLTFVVKITEGSAYKFGELKVTGLSPTAEKTLRQDWPFPSGGELFDKAVFEQFLTKLESKPADVFGKLPVHYDKVGHWLNRDEEKKTVDVALDFQ